MEPDPQEPRPPDGSSDHESSGLDGEDSGQASPELRRLGKLLEIIGDPTRLRILLSLNAEPKSTLDLAREVPPLTEDGMSDQLDFLRTEGLVETDGWGSYQAHTLTDLGRRLVQVALSLGID